MPKTNSQAELSNITEAIGAHAGGVGVDALFAALGGGIPRRTLQRRLAQLADARAIRAIGVGRATKYQRVLQLPAANFVSEPVAEYQTNAPYIPMSPEGAEIRAYVRRPRLQRRPVGYKIEFLEAYQPNFTAYLPAKLRENSMRWGAHRTRTRTRTPTLTTSLQPARSYVTF